MVNVKIKFDPVDSFCEKDRGLFSLVFSSYRTHHDVYLLRDS
jgi:hypothetical protein